MASVTIKGIKSFKDFTKKLDGKIKQFDGFVESLAQVANSSIQRRVQQKGLGSDLKKMSKYSEPYKKFKRATGRQTGHRDLTFRGHLWQSLSSERIGENKARMFFRTKEQNDKASGNEKRTPFFSITEMEDKVIEQAIKEFVRNL